MIEYTDFKKKEFFVAKQILMREEKNNKNKQTKKKIATLVWTIQVSEVTSTKY